MEFRIRNASHSRQLDRALVRAKRLRLLRIAKTKNRQLHTENHEHYHEKNTKTPYHLTLTKQNTSAYRTHAGHISTKSSAPSQTTLPTPNILHSRPSSWNVIYLFEWLAYACIVLFWVFLLTAAITLPDEEEILSRNSDSEEGEGEMESSSGTVEESG